MTDISLSTTTTKKAHQFILYFSYFIFFFPYIAKLFSFLSPLFVTTSILLIALLTLSNKTTLTEPSKDGFLFSFLQCVVSRVSSLLKTKCTDEHDQVCFEELEVYKIVFDMSFTENSSEVLEVEAKDIHLVSNGEETEVPVSDQLQKDTSFVTPGRDSGHDLDDHRTLEGSMEKYEDSSSKKEQNEVVKQEICMKKFNKVEEDELQNMKEGLNAITSKYKVSELTKASSANSTNTTTSSSSTTSFDFDDDDNDSDYYGTPNESKCCSPISSRKLMDLNMSNNNLRSFGSMRREKEWRRTLACKLFEERHSNIYVDASNNIEGMDLLWETYQETEQNSSSTCNNNNNSVTKVKSKNRTKKGQEVKSKNIKNNGYGYDSENEEDSEGQLCCLQALKFSTGKMNLGMGRHNLVKFSKAIKGFGWLHHLSSKHGKKVSY